MKSILRLLYRLIIAICSISSRHKKREDVAMSIESETNRAAYYGNGSTSTPYHVPFRYDAVSWLRVHVTSEDGELTELLPSSGFTITGSDLRTIAPVRTQDTLTISRATPLTQPLDLVPNAPLPAEALEKLLDQVVMQIQDRNLAPGKAGVRALTFPVAEPSNFNTELPIPGQRKNQFIGFDGRGEMVTKTPADIAYSILSHFGSSPSSEEVLAAISSLEPLRLTAQPTNATPGKFGQIAIVAGVLKLVPEEEDPFQPAVTGSTTLNDLLKQPLIEAGESIIPDPITGEARHFKNYSFSGGNPSSGINPPASMDMIIWVKYNPATSETNWVIEGRYSGIAVTGWMSSNLPDNPWDVGEWIPYSNEFITVTVGGLAIDVLPPQFWINTSSGNVAQWRRIFTSADLHPATLPSMDPHVAGSLFLDGTALNVSLG